MSYVGEFTYRSIVSCGIGPVPGGGSTSIYLWFTTAAFSISLVWCKMRTLFNRCSLNVPVWIINDRFANKSTLIKSTVAEFLISVAIGRHNLNDEDLVRNSFVENVSWRWIFSEHVFITKKILQAWIYLISRITPHDFKILHLHIPHIMTVKVFFGILQDKAWSVRKISKDLLDGDCLQHKFDDCFFLFCFLFVPVIIGKARKLSRLSIWYLFRTSTEECQTWHRWWRKHLIEAMHEEVTFRETTWRISF